MTFTLVDGGCGKGGQNGLPVGCGGPSVRIRSGGGWWGSSAR